MCLLQLSSKRVSNSQASLQLEKEVKLQNGSVCGADRAATATVTKNIIRITVREEQKDDY